MSRMYRVDDRYQWSMKRVPTLYQVSEHTTTTAVSITISIPVKYFIRVVLYFYSWRKNCCTWFRGWLSDNLTTATTTTAASSSSIEQPPHQTAVYKTPYRSLVFNYLQMIRTAVCHRNDRRLLTRTAWNPICSGLSLSSVLSDLDVPGGIIYHTCGTLYILRIVHTALCHMICWYK